MSEITRREWNRLMLSGLAATALPTGVYSRVGKPNSKFNGVQVGAQSYSFRDQPLDGAIAAMAQVGFSSCELWQGHAEPKELKGDALHEWRMSVPLDHFKSIRAKFDQAGIDIYAYNLSFRDDFSDREIERGFEMGQALGAKVLTASANISTAKRIDPFAKKFKLRVGMHNHSNMDPNEFATPDNFAAAMSGTSEYICINLDIGHFTAANFDAVDFLRQHHSRILTLHIKDRKRDQGPNVPFGEGDTPIKAVLLMLRKEKWPIPANIEYEYKGADAVEEVVRCFTYCKNILLS